MKKQEFITKIAEKAQVSKKSAGDVMDAMIQTVKEELEAGNESILHGIGKIKTVHRKARTGRNPRTGEAVQIEAKDTLKFQLTKGF